MPTVLTSKINSPKYGCKPLLKTLVKPVSKCYCLSILFLVTCRHFTLLTIKTAKITILFTNKIKSKIKIKDSMQSTFLFWTNKKYYH